MIARRKFLAWLGLAPVAAQMKPPAVPVLPTVPIAQCTPDNTRPWGITIVSTAVIPPPTVYVVDDLEVWDTPINANTELLDLVFNSTLSGSVTIAGVED